MSTHSSSSYERSETGFSEVSEERGPVSLSLDLEREGMPRRKAGRALNPPDMRGRNSSDHKIGDPVPQESGGVQRAVWNQGTTIETTWTRSGPIDLQITWLHDILLTACWRGKGCLIVMLRTYKQIPPRRTDNLFDSWFCISYVHVMNRYLMWNAISRYEASLQNTCPSVLLSTCPLLGVQKNRRCVTIMQACRSQEEGRLR